MNEQQRKLALRIRAEMFRDFIHDPDTPIWAEEYARRLLAAWQGSQEPVVYSDGYRKILNIIDSMESHDFSWHETLVEIRKIARTEYQEHPFVTPIASADALDAKRYRWMAGHYEEIAEWPDSAYANQDAFDAAIDAAMQEKRHD